MRKELNHVELIENNLLGRLSLDERRAFELKMNGDPSLRNDVQLQKNLTDRLQFLAFKTEMIASHNGLANLYKPWWKKGLYLNSLFLLVGLIIAATIITLNTDEKVEEKITTEFVTNKNVAEEQIIAATVTADEIIAEPESARGISRGKKNPLQNKLLHEGFIKPFSTSQINSKTGGTIQTKDSKSSIHFPADIFVSKNNEPVSGNVEIRYREFRNAAEMVLSQIPMVYSENGVDYNFNSAGMIEVRAFQNDEELKIKPGGAFTIDYNVTEQLDSCFFFVLNDDDKTWEKGQKIDFGQNAGTLGTGGPVFVGDENSPVIRQGILGGIVYDSTSARSWRGSIALYHQINYDESAKPAYRTEGDLTMYQINDIIPGTYIAKIVFQEYDGEKSIGENITIDSINIYDDKVTMLNIYPSWSFDKSKKTKSSKKFAISNDANSSETVRRKKRRRAGTGSYKSTYELKDSVMNIPKGRIGNRFLLADTARFQGMGISPNIGVNKTVLSPNLVQGLSCPAFGVYNCDQINKIKDQVAIRATYKDDNGRLIMDGYNLAMINFDYNASFGFIPDNFTCEWRGKTVLLLFTNQNKLYTISAEKFEEMNIVDDGHYTFEMSDITDQIKSSDDLKIYLGL